MFHIYALLSLCQVTKPSTIALCKSLGSMEVHPVQNLAAKLFVQCTRQGKLIDVYRKLMDHEGKHALKSPSTRRSTISCSCLPFLGTPTELDCNSKAPSPLLYSVEISRGMPGGCGF